MNRLVQSMYCPGYGLEHQATVIYFIPARGKRFFSSSPGSGAHQTFHSLGTSVFSPRLKRAGRDAYPTPPPSVEVKKQWLYTSTPPNDFMFSTGTTSLFTVSDENIL
jgi:hypothetical protein